MVGKLESQKVSDRNLESILSLQHGSIFGQKPESLMQRPCYAEIFRVSRHIKGNRLNMFHLLYTGHDPYPFDLDSIIEELNNIFSESIDINTHDTKNEKVKLIECIMKRDMPIFLMEMVYYIIFPIFRVMDIETPFRWEYGNKEYIDIGAKKYEYDGPIIDNISDLLFTYYNILGKSPHHDVNEIMGANRKNTELLKKLIENFIACNKMVFGTLDFDFMDEKFVNKSKTYVVNHQNSVYGIGRTGSFTFIEKLAKGKL